MCGCFCYCKPSRRPHDDNGDPSADKIFHKGWQSIIVSLGIAVFEDEVLSFHVSEFGQPATSPHQHPVATRRAHRNKANHRHRLLRPRRQRPSSRRTADEANKFAPLHGCPQASGSSSVSLSTRTGRVGGRLNEISLAVAMSGVGLGCVKTPKLNLRTEISSRLQSI